ncbi:hypothetical protein PG994_012693 [Apiospora phragmitis]|uniref:Uncharacterized protein n=1 Tax=Apiospora phragmitis TaxID=2905665 RepID=A0ABR1TB58_9PEZI
MSTSTASSAALRLPEIVALIVDHIYQEVQARRGRRRQDLYQSTDYVDTPGVRFKLRKAAFRHLVYLNSLWFHSVISVLWRHPTQTQMDPCLTELFCSIEPARRNIYAQYIERGTLVFAESPELPCPRRIWMTKDQKKQKTPEQWLAAVDFLRMRTLIVKSGLGNNLPLLGRNCVEDVFFICDWNPDYLQGDLDQFEVRLKRVTLY